MTHNNQTYYLHYDQVGTLRAVSNQENQIVKEITYDTFGNILQDTNLVHFGYREYDPKTGKWTAKDPIDFSGGDSNLYGYVLGDPVEFIDPMGLYMDPLLAGTGVPAAMGGNGKGKGKGSGGFPKGPFGPQCGASGHWSATWLIPDITPQACEKHDNCYSDCSKTKQECDLEFYQKNSIYGQAVWVGGQDAYNKAQEHCKCSQ